MKQNQPTLWNRGERFSENRWSPLAEFRTEFDRLFDDFLGTGETAPAKRMNDWLPACDIQEAEGHFLISLEVPGIPQEQIRLEVVDHRLRISGERKAETKSEKSGRWYTERNYGRFERSFALPENVDSDRMEAHYDHGVLRVFVPKAEVAKPREIKIQNGNGTGFFDRLLGKSVTGESAEKH